MKKRKQKRDTVRKMTLSEPNSQKRGLMREFNRVPGDLELWAMRYLDRNNPYLNVLLPAIFARITAQTGETGYTIEGYHRLVMFSLCEAFCHALDNGDVPAIESIVSLLKNPPPRDNPLRSKLHQWQLWNPGRSIYGKELASEINFDGPIEVLIRIAKEEFGIEIKDGRKNDSDK